VICTRELGSILRNRWKLLFVGFSLLIALVFFQQVKSGVVVLALALLAAFGQIYKRYLRVPSALEFVTFGTVLVGSAYGPVAGAVFALATSFAAEVISGGIDAFVVIYLPVRVVSGVLAAVLPFSSITAIGITVTLFINAASQPPYFFQPDTELRIKAVIYLVLNLVWNSLLFNAFASQVAMHL
jgi:hypothetical protein